MLRNCSASPIGARGPSTRRMISLKGICAGSRRNWYPPRAPRTLSTIRAFFSSSRISSRNFSGKSLSAAISRILIAPCSCRRASVIIACNAYSPFCEIFTRQPSARLSTISFALPRPPRMPTFRSYTYLWPLRGSHFVESLGPVLVILVFFVFRSLFQQNRSSSPTDDSDLNRQADAYVAQGNLQLAEQTLNRLLQ